MRALGLILILNWFELDATDNTNESLQDELIPIAGLVLMFLEAIMIYLTFYRVSVIEPRQSDFEIIFDTCLLFVDRIRCTP